MLWNLNSVQQFILLIQPADKNDAYLPQNDFSIEVINEFLD